MASSGVGLPILVMRLFLMLAEQQKKSKQNTYTHCA
jgi:hypothetical protein